MATTPRTFLVLSVLATLAAQPPALAANTASAEPAPAIQVSGIAEVSAPAARGAFSIGVEVTRPTAAAASAEAARITQSVTAALKKAGLPAADLKSSRLIVNPQWSYDDKARQQRLDGFRADNTLRVDTHALDQAGSFIDAALGAGATSVSDLQYFPADEAGLRREALGRAVKEAQADATAIAAAAGGTLGPLISISAEPGTGMPMPIRATMAMASVAAPRAQTVVIPDEIHVSASVSTSWRFLPAAHVP